MRATRLLESQHLQVTSLINRLLRRTAGRNRRVNDLADALAAHMLVEEEILYPVARNVQRSVIEHAIEEHDLIAIEMQRLLATPREERAFEVRLEVMRTLLQHHVIVEESAVFPTLDQLLSRQQNDVLGRQVAARFRQVLPEGSQQILSMRETDITCPAPGQIGAPGRRRRRDR